MRSRLFPGDPEIEKEHVVRRVDGDGDRRVVRDRVPAAALALRVRVAAARQQRECDRAAEGQTRDDSLRVLHAILLVAYDARARTASSACWKTTAWSPGTTLFSPLTTPMKASTTTGLNCVPALARSSF